MSNLRKHRVPLITAAGMIAIPLAFAFLSGAGAGTALGGLARLLGVFFTIFRGREHCDGRLFDGVGRVEHLA